jgi:hypothetical protein
MARRARRVASLHIERDLMLVRCPTLVATGEARWIASCRSH